MPVTVTIAGNAAETINNSWYWSRVDNKENILPRAESQKSKGVIQCSILPKEFSERNITCSNNGLVWAAYHAYSDHHHLTLRPEDIWFAIISQLSFYINAYAEELRHMFVAHEGKINLEVQAAGTIHTVNFGQIAKALADLIQKNIKRPDLQAWIIPSFSTTAEVDRAVASMLLMGTMKQYFTYSAGLICGIPSVTLLGEREDWENILQRLDVLPDFGKETAEFAGLLRPILRGFIATFESERREETIHFWNRIADMRGGSGPTYMSGWITAFCFWHTNGKKALRNGRMIDFNTIPSGYVTVPLRILDDGAEIRTQIVAGSFGMEAFSQQKSAGTLDDQATTEEKSTADAMLSDGDTSFEEQEASLDSIKPLTGWIVYHERTLQDKRDEQLQAAAEELRNRPAPNDDIGAITDWLGSL
jgi:hypothetical protein